MDPDDISTQLRLRPSRKWKAGSRRTTPTGKQLAGTNNETYCVFDLDAKTRDNLYSTLCTGVKKLLAFKPVLQEIRSTGGTIEFFVGLFVKINTGIVLDRSLMAQLTELGIDLSLDIYSERQSTKKVAPQKTGSRSPH
jgi:hypothetical protein